MSDYSDLLSYYSNLLIAQFAGKPKAVATIEQLVSGILMGDGAGSTLPLDVLNGFNLTATVQTISFSAVPVSGHVRVNYGNPPSSVYITASDDASSVWGAFQDLFGPKVVATSGSPASQSIVVNFEAIPNPQTIYVDNNTLLDGSGSAVAVSVATNIAVGQQLDWLGKYVGVTRSGIGINGQPITLSDADFLQFIRIAIATNNFGSSLATIQDFIATFFAGSIQVFDYANTAPMQMSYLIATEELSEDLIQLTLAQGLLPVPIAVSYSVIGAPTITNFFGLSDYSVSSGAQPANTTPLNSIDGYTLLDTNENYRWMDYSYSLRN